MLAIFQFINCSNMQTSHQRGSLILFKVEDWVSFLFSISMIIKNINTMSLSLQGDQLYIDVCYWYLIKSDLSVFAGTVAYTEHVAFYEVLEKHGSIVFLLCKQFD